MNSTRQDIDDLRAEIQVLKKRSRVDPVKGQGYYSKKKSHNKFFMVTTILLLVILIAGGSYAYFFYTKTRDQVTKLNTRISQLNAEKVQQQTETERVSSRADTLQRQVGELQTTNDQLSAQLKVKPKTVTVYQQPAPAPSTYYPQTTTCNPNVFGGFTCY